MTRRDDNLDATLYHDPEDCPYTEAVHRFDPATGLCAGHTIPRPPAPCPCQGADFTNPCANRSADRDEAPYCTDCYTARVYGIAGRDCVHHQV